MTTKLYTHQRSGNAYKVRLMLSLMGQKAEQIEVDITADEQHTAAFLALSPRGEIPVLIDGDLILRDSAAIRTYLAGLHAPAI